jgi:thiol-disulfide isomerase/thioredoxin
MTKISWTGMLTAALLLALLLTVACGGGGSGETGTGDEDDGADKEMAADFPIIVSQGQDILGGDQVAMASLVGERPVVLNFWAAECPPCRAELPEFQEFHEEYGDRILVLGVDLGQFTNQGTTEQGLELLAELGVHIPAGYTEDAQILPKYTVLGLPTTVFINADGSIHNKWTGALNKETLIEKAEEMLGG